jgi:hypothetical protein
MRFGTEHRMGTYISFLDYGRIITVSQTTLLVVISSVAFGLGTLGVAG